MMSPYVQDVSTNGVFRWSGAYIASASERLALRLRLLRVSGIGTEPLPKNCVPGKRDDLLNVFNLGTVR